MYEVSRTRKNTGPNYTGKAKYYPAPLKSSARYNQAKRKLKYQM